MEEICQLCVCPILPHTEQGHGKERVEELPLLGGPRGDFSKSWHLNSIAKIKRNQ